VKKEDKSKISYVSNINTNNNKAENYNEEDYNNYDESKFEDPEIPNDNQEDVYEEFKEIHEIDKIQSRVNFFENSKIDILKSNIKHVIQDDVKFGKGNSNRKIEDNKPIYSHHNVMPTTNNILNESHRDFKQSEEFFEVVEINEVKFYWIY